MLADYRPPPGAYDELFDGDAIRPVWRPVTDHVTALGADDLAQRLARGDEYLRDAGVYLRRFGTADAAARAWPLSYLPVVLAESDWRDLVAGLSQRADLLEAIAADFYGPNALAAAGHLPAELIAASPEWLRPMVGIRPASGHYLHFIAFDVARGPAGDWWVLGDRTQAPSGAGFALEHRVATARVFSELYARANVHRLAGFFRDFRDGLAALAPDGEARAAILTPGSHTDTYFEHAYIARYLGLMLLEGADLTTIDGALHVRTVAGPQPVGVLWRRLDASYADPLELDDMSRLGTAGLLQALRGGRLSMVNALGTGLLETRALLAFMPRLCRALRGEPLMLANVATWWCGDPEAAAHVAANRDRMVLGGALSTDLAYRSGPVDTMRGWANPAASDDATLYAASPELFVGQQRLAPSVTPAIEDGRIVARPVTLRIFLARTADGWSAMPGGFARLGPAGTASVEATAQDGVADVWVVADTPVEPVTLVARPGAAYARPPQGTLPARAADNLFWLGRYVERSEDIIRLVRACRIRRFEAGGGATPLLDHLAPHLARLGIEPERRVPVALLRTIRSAVASAEQVRDRFSVDGWAALQDLERTAASMDANDAEGDDEGRALGVLLRKISGFSGLVHENMYRFTGWRFMRIGRSLERVVATASLLEHLCGADAPDGALDLAVEVADSVLSHRRRFSVATRTETVVDLLALDGMNPRAILFQVTEVEEQLRLLPAPADDVSSRALAAAASRLAAALAGATPDLLRAEGLADICRQAEILSDSLSECYLR